MLLPVHHSHHYSASIFVHISASSDDFCSHFSKYEDIMIQTELPATICSPILQSSQSFLHYIHALVLLLSLNRWSLAGPLNVITGSSELLTDTCWGPGMAQAPQKSHYHRVTYIAERMKQDVHSHTIFITYPAVSLRKQTVWRQMVIPFFFYLSALLLKFTRALPPVKS